MSNKIKVKELPKNPIERTYTLDEYSGRLVVYLDKRWQFAEDVTAYENSRNSYRKVVKQI
jgi:hypothetical protein